MIENIKRHLTEFETQYFREDMLLFISAKYFCNTILDLFQIFNVIFESLDNADF